MSVITHAENGKTNPLTAIKEQLIELPDQIAVAATKHYEATLMVTAAKDTLKFVDANLLAAIEAEVDATTGKPRYSNEIKRNAALITARAEDATYETTYLAVAAADAIAVTLRIELERLQDTLSSQRHLADLMSGYYRRNG